ncbi:MAG: DUF465 domain-containing protein [Terriglobales bacterium]
MNQQAAIIQEDLMAHNEAYRQLSQQHSALEAELRGLRERRFLSGDEQAQELQLKKRKLQIKDAMEALLRRWMAGAGAA